MNKEDKELLLKDLCARLPYHPRIHICNDSWEGCRIGEFDNNMWFHHVEAFLCNRIEILPYLRPMSSMTEEEENKYNSLNAYEGGIFPHTEEAFDWLNKYHFDYRGLIDKGLAIEVAENNNPYK